ncbi:3-phosphoshikimate 1-carboxyvinyltransferase [Clostridia bacterium]|nr:3-phosphoshikimate 1-carboxyvinyltransferase [Clostridia bacterium]
MVINNFPSGEITPPPSKSLSHRALICAWLSGADIFDPSCVKNLGDSNDIRATKRCLDALRNKKTLDCGESGSTLRFLMPLAALQGGADFIESGQLHVLERPLWPYKNTIDFLQKRGRIRVASGLKSGDYALHGDVSSQFFSGLLMALPLVNGDSTLIFSSPLESRSYVEMTLDVMEAFGVHVESLENGWKIPGNQRYVYTKYTVEADYSQAAFFLAAAALGRDVVCKGLSPDSRQGDREIVEIVAKIGNSLQPVDVDAGNIPDIVPPIAALCCFCNGESHIYNAGRLRLKECDRLHALAVELSKLGADITEGADNLTIRGKNRLSGGTADSHGDHRIAMSIAVAAIGCDAPVELTGWESVGKSYPNFWKDWGCIV